MRKVDQDTAISAVLLQQVIMEWCYILDFHGGTNVSSLCTEDCAYMLGGTPFVGHEAIENFYVARNERVRTQQKDGVRTQRHTICNIRYRFDGKERATAYYTLVNYSSEGKPPALDLNLKNPSIIADVEMDFRHGADGEWRISRFDSTPVFIGNDPFLNASVAKK